MEGDAATGDVIITDMDGFTLAVAMPSRSVRQLRRSRRHGVSVVGGVIVGDGRGGHAICDTPSATVPPACLDGVRLAGRGLDRLQLDPDRSVTTGAGRLIGEFDDGVLRLDA